MLINSDFLFNRLKATTSVSDHHGMILLNLCRGVPHWISVSLDSPSE